ncbi:MAG: adenylate/guanylate cyclase domain-containing protein [Rhodoferax sp.]|nr:adenylate/guanylate cyclase domain-containing protein [Rhodoferax sp.]
MLPAAVVLLALFIQFQDPQFRARMRDNAFDQLQSLAPQHYQEKLPIRVVAIDDTSLSELGQWPWPRPVLADLTDQLTRLGARVIALDIVLPEPDRSSPEQIARRYAGQRVLHDLLIHMPAHDQVLAESFARGTVALGFSIAPLAVAAPLPPAKARFLVFGGSPANWLPPYRGAVASLPLLTEAARGSGAISLAPGSDGVLRAVPLLQQVGGVLYPELGLEALRLFSGADNLALQISAAGFSGYGVVPGIRGVGIGHASFLPTAPDGKVWLHFRPLTTQRYISARDVLAGRVDARLIRDHIVFIGVTAAGLGDTVASPLGELIPGVEGHVQLVEQMMTGDYLLQPAWENDFLALLLLAVALSLWFLLARCRPVWSVMLALGVVAGLFVLTGWLFVAQHLLLDPFYPALAVSALFVSMVMPQYLRTESEQRWIREAFSRYVSPNRVKHLQDHRDQIELGGSYRECSFVMTDLEGFTALMERHQPALLSDMLNEYLDNMIQIAFRHDGTLDRIVGDAVAVMFSAPLTQTDHAARALACALEMDAFAQACRQRRQLQGIAFGRTRIGVSTGTVLVGNFGGKSMLDYRALGDAVNTAARLESINVHIGTRVCVSESTVAQCPGFVGRPVGRLLLKGKTEAVQVYEPLTQDEAQSERVISYRSAYALLQAQQPAAQDAFARLHQNYPDDTLIAYHANRLAAGDTGTLVVMKNK